jgi:fused signal recognition particle receptor
MFKFLKEKLNNVVKKFSKDVEEESEKIDVEEVKQPEIKKEVIENKKQKEISKEVQQEKKQEKLAVKETRKEESKKEDVKKPAIKETKEKKPDEERDIIAKSAKKKEITKETAVEIEKPVLKKKEEFKDSKKQIPTEKTFSEPEEKKKSKDIEINKENTSIKEEIVPKEKELTLKEIKAEEILEEHKAHKKGFFSKLFGHKEKVHDEVHDKELDDEIKEKEKQKEIVPEKAPEKKEITKKESKKEEITIIDEIEEDLDKEIEEDLEEEIEKEEAEEEREEEKTEEEISRIEISETEEEKEQSKQKRGFFTKITETFTKINLSEDKFEELFWDLEVMLLENNVAVEVILKIKDDLKQELMSDKISRKNVDEIIKDSLKKSLEEVLDVKGFDLEEKIKNKKPYVIAVIGVNGSGKTTTIAKLCHLLKKKGYSVVLAAADTFRAAAIQQLEHHAEKLDIKMIKHDYNSDPAAVAFDAIKHAEAKKIDVVIIDTAGRLHSNDNLMNELKKLIKVNKPDLKLFVGESITGNDCVEQAKVYDEIIGIDAIILSKADIDEKGGAALSISYVTQKPVLFVGTGQTYDDLLPFDKKEIMQGLGF